MLINFWGTVKSKRVWLFGIALILFSIVVGTTQAIAANPVIPDTGLTNINADSDWDFDDGDGADDANIKFIGSTDANLRIVIGSEGDVHGDLGSIAVDESSTGSAFELWIGDGADGGNSDLTLTINGIITGKDSLDIFLNAQGDFFNEGDVFVEFFDDVNLGIGTLTLDDAAGGTGGGFASIYFTNTTDHDEDGTQTFTGDIAAEDDGDGEVYVVTSATDTVVFTGTVGTDSNRISWIQVGVDGDSELPAGNNAAGNAIFKKSVYVDNLDIDDSNNDGGSTALFEGTLDVTYDFYIISDADADVGTAYTSSARVEGDLTVGGDLVIVSSYNIDAIAELTTESDADITGDVIIAAEGSSTARYFVEGNLKVADGSSVILDEDDPANDKAQLIVNGTVAQTIDAVIEAESDDEGTIYVYNDSGATFKQAVGESEIAISLIAIGGTGGSDNGAATFEKDVYADHIFIDANDGNSSATFNGNIDLVSGTVVNGSIELDDAETEYTATITFDGSTGSLPHTVLGEIEAVNDGDGVVNINEDTTLTGAIGAVSNAVGIMNIDDGATFILEADPSNVTDLSATASAIDNVYLGSGTGGTFEVDSSEAGGEFTFTGDISPDTGENSVGTLRLGGTDNNIIIDGNVGSAGSEISDIEVTDLANELTATFNENVYAKDVTINAASDTDENQVFFGDSDEAVILISGNIYTVDAQNDEHSLTFRSTTSQNVDGNIGTSTAKFKLVEVENDLTANGDLYATDVSITDTMVLTLTGADATLDAIINGADEIDGGDLVIGNGTDSSEVTYVNTAIGVDNSLDSIVVVDNATLNLKSTGALSINVGNSLDSGAFVVSSNATLNIDSANGAVEINALNGSYNDINLGGKTSIVGANNVDFYSIDEIFIDGTLSTSLTDAGVLSFNTSSPGTIYIGSVVDDTTLTVANDISLISAGDIVIGAGGNKTYLNIVRNADYDPVASDGVLDLNGSNLVLEGDLVVGLQSLTGSYSDGDVVTVIVNAGSTDLSVGGGVVVETDTAANEIVLYDTATVDLQHNTGSDENNLLISIIYKEDVDGVSGQQEDAFDSALAATHAGGDQAAWDGLMNLMGNQTEDIVEQIALQTDTMTGAVQAMVGTSSKIFGVAQGRMESLRVGVAYASAGMSGLSAGDVTGEGTKGGLWVKPFARTASQDEIKTVKGHDVDTYGIQAGFDVNATESIRIGLAAGYSNSDVDGDGLGASHLDIDGYQVTLYGDYTSDRFFVEAMAGYGKNSIDSIRTISFVHQGVAEADYDSDQFMLSLAGGMPFNIGKNTFLTPKIGVSWITLDIDGYTETGSAGVLNMVVEDSDYDLIEASFGLKLHSVIETAEGVLIPGIWIGASYNVNGDDIINTAAYTGGGPSFVMNGAETDDFIGNAGIELIYDSNQWSIGANYNFEIGDNLTAHAVAVDLLWKF